MSPLRVLGCILVAVLVGLGTSSKAQPASPSSPRRPNENCPTKCGDITIPYPWGIGDECSMSPDFNLSCNYTFKSPLPQRKDFTIVSIDLPSAKMRWLMDISYQCYDRSGLADYSMWSVGAHYYGWFTFSNTENTYIAVGCDTVAFFTGEANSSYTGGCISMCDNNDAIADGDCSGMGCCQTSLPTGLAFYNATFDSGHNHTNVLDFNPCNYGFLVEKNNYTFHKSDLGGMDKNRRFPIVVDWFIGDKTCEQVKNTPDYACVSSNSYCANSTNGSGYVCHCYQGYEGNPYLQDGCQDINECESPEKYPCEGDCINAQGNYSCTCRKGTHGNATTGCMKNEKEPLKIVLAVASCSLFAIVASICLYSQLQRRRLAEMKRKFFEKNGGNILEEHLESSTHIRELLKIFTKAELERATDRFDERRILGRGGQGVVFEGGLEDGTRVAIKKSVVVDGQGVKEFINEIVILSQINHRNVVKLLGCCLEVEVPLLVYEFVPNKTLQHHIHNQTTVLSWESRVRIAAETSSALAYLHSSASVPILHRDVKSANILLDGAFTAKVSDFGASRLVPTDKDQLSTLVQGTMGYLDPECLQTQQLTDKSDVYSFGVVLLELLTGKQPINYGEGAEVPNLSTFFLLRMKENSLSKILDTRVATEEVAAQMLEVAGIAERCLSMKGEDRPPMVEVAMSLERLRRSSVGNNSMQTRDPGVVPTTESPPVGAGVDETAFNTTQGVEALQPLHIEVGR